MSNSFIFDVLQTSFRPFQPTANSTFGINAHSGLKLLIHLRVSFSHLREHKFKHNFQDNLKSFCACSLEAEDIYHFPMGCQNFSHKRNVFFDDLDAINLKILKMRLRLFES